MEFNWEKAYCVIAVPAFESLSSKQKAAFDKLHEIVGDRRQNNSLHIPTCEKTNDALKELSCLEIAELSRASYYTGHWKPSKLPELFDSSKGEYWKISNVCDQELRKRLNPPSSLLIHEGMLRVTFSNKYCWLWEEFGLATEKNINRFKYSGFSFDENSLEKNAKKLAEIIGDLWPDVNTVPNNDLYNSYLISKGEK